MEGYESTTTTEGGGPLNKPIKMKGFYTEPGHLRAENERLISIADFAAGKSISLDREHNRAAMFSFSPQSLAENIPGNLLKGNWISAMRQFLKQASTDPNAKVQSLGAEQLDDRSVVGYRLELASQIVTLWIDAMTQLPVRIEVAGMGPPKYEIVYTNFEFNVELDSSIFKLDVPEGFTLSEASIDVSSPTESDLVGSLEMFTQKFEGKFPPKFDPVSLGWYVQAYPFQERKSAKRDAPNDWLQSVLTFRRGFQFAYLLPKESDAHYAGIEAEFGDQDRAVFWYKPAGSDTYRVIYADLAVRDSTEAPKIQDAIRLSNS